MFNELNRRSRVILGCLPDSTTVLLSTSSVILLELRRTAPPLLLSTPVTFILTALLRDVTITLVFKAKPAGVYKGEDEYAKPHSGLVMC